MASQSTARASRAAIRRGQKPLESIWITDKVLTSAFKRYCNICTRKSSSVPGPLENRRRLGMRKMTGLYSTELQPTLPTWMLESPPDLSEWTWSPPTSQKVRKGQKPRDVTPTNAGFLDMWASAAILSAAMPSAAIPSKAQSSSPALEEKVVPADSYSLLLDKAIKSLRRFLYLPEVGHEKYTLAMTSLQKDIYLGIIPAAEIPDMLAGFTQRMDELFDRCLRASLPPENMQQFELARVGFVGAIIRGLSKSKVQGLEQMEPETCNTLLTMLSKSRRSEEAIMLFQLFMQTASDSYANQVSSGIETYLRNWLTFTMRLPTRIGNALKSGDLDMREGTKLFNAFEALVTKTCAGQERDEAVRTHTAWLVLLAHSPYVRTTYFVDALEKYVTFADNWSKSRERQVCELLVFHWKSQRAFGKWDNANWRSFGGILCSIRSDDQLNQVKEFLAVLKRIAPREVLLKSITKYCDKAESICGRRLSLIASGFDDPGLSHSLLDLAEVHRHKLLKLTFPLRLTKLPYLKDMVLDPRVEVSKIWEVVNSLSEDDYNMLQLKKEVTRALSTWFASAEHLGDRVMLRNVSRCNAWLRSMNEVPDQDSLLAVIRAGIRDLKRGEPGRFERHEWLLRLTKDCLGPQEGTKMAKLLWEWQERNMAAQREPSYTRPVESGTE